MMDFVKKYWEKVKPFFCETIKTARCCGCLVLQKTKQLAPAILWVFIVACFACLLWVLSSDGIPQELKQAIGSEVKPDIIRLIGWGMGGLLAAVVALALNRRADEMANQNKLTEKGHVNERFKSAVESLASAEPSARIASFYQFYYLAKSAQKSHDDDFRRSVFDILCAHLRHTTSTEKYRAEEGKDKPTEEVQSLLDVLVKPHDKTVFAGIKIQLRGAYLANVDLFLVNLQGATLSDANLQSAYLRLANLRGAELWNTDLQDADLCFAKLQEADLSGANLQSADFTMANLEQADLSDTKNANDAKFNLIKWDEETVFPSDITILGKDGKKYKTGKDGKPEKVPEGK